MDRVGVAGDLLKPRHHGRPSDPQSLPSGTPSLLLRTPQLSLQVAIKATPLPCSVRSSATCGNGIVTVH